MLFTKHSSTKGNKQAKWDKLSAPTIPKSDLNVDAQCLLEVTNICSDNEENQIDLFVPQQMMLSDAKGLVKSAFVANMHKRGKLIIFWRLKKILKPSLFILAETRISATKLLHL